MAILCAQYNLLFIQIGGRGSSSIGNVLTRQYGGETFAYEEAVNKDGTTYNKNKHITVPEIIAQGYADEEQLARYVIFASVRNPFDYLVSSYSKMKLQQLYGVRDRKDLPPGTNVAGMEPDPQDFEKWIARRFSLRRGLQHRLRVALGRARKWSDGLDGVDRVVRVENMVEDLNRILADVGAPPVEQIANVNPSVRRPDYRVYYTPRAREIAELIFRRDIETHGYEF